MDDLFKQKLMAGIVGLNFTVIIYNIVLYLIYGSDSWGTFFIRLLISLVIGAVVGAGVFFAVGMGQK
jgi:hypothetical protein